MIERCGPEREEILEDAIDTLLACRLFHFGLVPDVAVHAHRIAHRCALHDEPDPVRRTSTTGCRVEEGMVSL